MNLLHKFSLLGREDLLSAVNVLTNRPKILVMTNRDTFQLYFPGSFEKMW